MEPLTKEQLIELKKQEKHVKRIWGNSEIFLDKVVTTLATGLLSFTIAFSDGFASAGYYKIYLNRFLGALFVSVISVVLSHIINTFAAPNEIVRLDRVKKRELEFNVLQCDSRLTWMVKILNYISSIAFVIALVFLAIFIFKK